MPLKERNLSMYRSKFFHFCFICLLGLLSACSSVEVFVENREIPFQKTYRSFMLVNKELGIAGFSDPKLDQQVQEALEEQLLAAGFVYDAKQPDLVIRYHSNEDLRQRERVNNMNPYPFWGMRMYDPWLFNPMMGNFNSQEVENIKRALDIRIDGYEVKLLNIGDFEMDDDRYWYPSIAFTFIKDNQNVLN